MDNINFDFRVIFLLFGAYILLAVFRPNYKKTPKIIMYTIYCVVIIFYDFRLYIDILINKSLGKVELVNAIALFGLIFAIIEIIETSTE